MLRSASVVLLIPMVSWSVAQDPNPPQQVAAPPKTYSQAVVIQSAQTNASNEAESSLRNRALREGPRPSWIWGESSDTRYIIRKKFSVGQVANAWMVASCDNAMIVSLNGKILGESDSWEEGLALDASQAIQPGENVLSFEVWNAGGIAALVAKMAMVDPQGGIRHLGTGSDWEVAPKDTPTEFRSAKVIAEYGSGPWGNVLENDARNAGGAFATLPGFVVERLFRVPKEELGSWVCLTTDPKGRLIASDQENRGLFRITPPEPGTDAPTLVEKLQVELSGAQGLLFAFDSLYVSVNGGRGSGLYRLRDTDGDDQFDEVKKLKEFRGGGEHGPHALRLSPDGKSIYVSCGNHTLPPADRKTNAPPQTMGGPRSEQLTATLPDGFTSRIAPVWDEDLLLPRQWDANGHAAGILAPGGWIAKTDPDGAAWELVSIGYRNQYDFDFDTAGEMFVYDADMEWDMGTPWYRPTRVVHATSGSEFGWRSGTGKWPEYYVDSLPSLVDIGPGSPVGVAFGTGAKFPAKYQRALYVCDWTFGTMYAIHTEMSGGTYRATKEEFLSRTPLPLTDVTIGTDGHLYFTVGGRGTQSELYRVRYAGDASTAPVTPLQLNAEHQLRRQLEQYHTASVSSPEQVAAQCIANLRHPDRHVRYAARVALERLPVSLWKEAVLSSSDPETLITGAAALARVGDASLREPLLGRLGALDAGRLTLEQKRELARAAQLILIRLGALEDSVRNAMRERIEPAFPSDDADLNRELVILLTFLESPTIAGKVLPLLAQERRLSEADFAEILQRNRGYGASIAAMLENQPDLQQFHYAFSLRNLKSGWNMDQRKAYFGWFQKAQGWKGGASYEKFLINAANDAYALCNDQERFVLEALGVRKPASIPKELPLPEGPGKTYTTEEVAKWVPTRMMGRNFERGRKMYAAARCVVCHRFGGEGGATGPDLTQVAGRFSPADLIDAIVRPSQVISDQYKTMVLQTHDGTVHTGRIVSDVGGKVTLVVDPEDATKTVTLDRDEIEQERVSTTSLMPAELLDKLSQDEVLDLLAYLLSRGDANGPMYRKK